MSQTPASSAGPESIKRRIVWAVLFFLSVGGLAIMTVSGIKQRNYISCNAEQVEVLIKWQREASAVAREEREAGDQIRVARRAKDVEAENRAIDSYFKTREEADRRRAANPLPDLPENICGRDPNSALR